MTASRNTRSSRGDNSSRRLQRIRRPTRNRDLPIPQKERRSSFDSNKSGRSIGTLGTLGVGDDMSQYQYSIDPSLLKEGQVIITSPIPNCYPDPHLSAEMTIDDKSLYTSCDPTVVTHERDWEEMRMHCEEERKRKMEMAGQDNSIPTMITSKCYVKTSKPQMITTGSVNVSKLQMTSGRSVFSFDPTEEESFESTHATEEPTTTNHGGGVDTIEEATLYPEPRLPAPKKKKTKKNFLKRFWKALFHNSKKERNSSSIPRKNLVRQSAPALMSPSELWDSVDVPKTKKPSSTPTLEGGTMAAAVAQVTKRSRHGSAPVKKKLAPQDLWAPEQAQARGMPAAKLRVSETGVREWENASGRIVPYNAAEC